jgi:hypothetical protein
VSQRDPAEELQPRSTIGKREDVRLASLRDWFRALYKPLGTEQGPHGSFITLYGLANTAA